MSDQVNRTIQRSFEVADAAAAYEHFARPGKFGKIVLLVEQ